jgi:pSer/pThr/pTyr-binding forkhead associated (FHA) protein
VFVVYDDNSANGTYVNGQRVSMQALASGDIVQFGSSKFRFE